MAITLTFERNMDSETIDVSLTPEITENTCRVEKAWGKLGLGFAQKVAEKHTFELNRMRDDKPCSIEIESDTGNAVSLTYRAPETQGTIGGLSSATLAMSSIVYSMMQEAVESNGEMQDEEEFIDDEDEDDIEMAMSMRQRSY